MRGYSQIAKARPHFADAIDHGESVVWFDFVRQRRVARFVREPVDVGDPDGPTRVVCIDHTGNVHRPGAREQVGKFLERMAQRCERVEVARERGES